MKTEEDYNHIVTVLLGSIEAEMDQAYKGSVTTATITALKVSKVVKLLSLACMDYLNRYSLKKPDQGSIIMFNLDQVRGC